MKQRMKHLGSKLIWSCKNGYSRLRINNPIPGEAARIRRQLKWLNVYATIKKKETEPYRDATA